MELKLMIMMPYIYLQAPTQLNEWVYCFNCTMSHSLGEHRREKNYGTMQLLCRTINRFEMNYSGLDDHVSNQLHCPGTQRYCGNMVISKTGIMKNWCLFNQVSTHLLCPEYFYLNYHRYLEKGISSENVWKSIILPYFCWSDIRPFFRLEMCT